jgi:hypothetical protein
MNCPHCGQVGCVGGVIPGECDKMPFRELTEADFKERLISAGWKSWEAEREWQDIQEERESGE